MVHGLPSPPYGVRVAPNGALIALLEERTRKDGKTAFRVVAP
jgi:hypothetical protein